jgi:Arylsulfotransferase (ASST)
VALRRVALAGAACALALPAAALGTGVRVTAEPGLRPAFGVHVTDHVSACRAGRPLRLSITAPPGRRVSVDGGRARGGSFTATVALGVGQSTQIVVRSNGRKRRHHVRCLPDGFPAYLRFERRSRPGAQWYLIAPSQDTGETEAEHYVALLDGRGTPVWWKRAVPAPFNSLLLAGGKLAWTRWYGDPFGLRDESAWEIHRLDGSLVRTLRTVGSPTDTHDMEPLPNGNFLLTTYRVRRNVDVTPYGGPPAGNVLDGEIQEIDRHGKVAWSWNSKDHIKPRETERLQGKFLRDGTPAYDVFHLNSVEPDGDGYVISARHVNAVYRIDRGTGDVDWKLGGTKRAESLKPLGDPLSPTFGAQHDARLLPDGTLTVFDNRSDIGAPRGVRFRIDRTARTARWLGQVTDPKAPDSGAEGSARRLRGGHWAVSWGGTPVMSELTAANALVWRLKFETVINYRLTPIPSGRLRPSRLRRAMDSMNPRG